MAKKTKYDLIVPPRFLYRYRPLHDEFSSIQQMLERDRWWFGSRTKFDDSEDMLSPEYDLWTQKSRGGPERRTRSS
jgi:hypothetical protein